jgi:hypothetical protein
LKIKQAKMEHPKDVVKASELKVPHFDETKAMEYLGRKYNDLNLYYWNQLSELHHAFETSVMLLRPSEEDLFFYLIDPVSKHKAIMNNINKELKETLIKYYKFSPEVAENFVQGISPTKQTN